MVRRVFWKHEIEGSIPSSLTKTNIIVTTSPYQNPERDNSGVIITLSSFFIQTQQRTTNES